ncbi:MAG: thiolase family protein [Candidatus Methanolliviera hydrocarbonicum]|uniref:Thiolase family protein n=1 Tax=Candidatus Methanolliviera hydrocarbonicum TaxID=2491085 RepID=A0A520KXI7_9EURY|nr:MAG: thiolase family protein [Candidatus Methanolliviera hydrocarbonicum]
MKKVGIVEVTQSPGAESSLSLMEFTYKTVKELLDKVGMRRDEVDTYVMASSDVLHSGMSCANSFDIDATGGFLKPFSRTEGDAITAFVYGCMRIMSGNYDTALIVGLIKGSENADNDTITSCFADPFYSRPTGINETTAAAMQMRLYLQRYGITEEQCAKVVVKNLGNALFNPYTHIKKRVSVEDVLGSERICDPLKAMECAPKSDGVCAMLLASEEKAKELTDKPVWFKGWGASMDTFYLGDRDLLDTPLKSAAASAYKMAGISNPRKAIDMAEICEPYAFQELLWCEQLGLCGQGEGGKLIDSGATQMNGSLPVNPSGGVLAMNPYVSRGLYRVAEAALQIKGKAGEHQIDKKVNTALAHATYGFCGQWQGVVILGS